MKKEHTKEQTCVKSVGLLRYSLQSIGIDGIIVKNYFQFARNLK